MGTADVKLPIPGYGEITAYRSPQDDVLVIEIDTTQAAEVNGTADGAGLPRLRVYVNDGPVWEHPPYDQDNNDDGPQSTQEADMASQFKENPEEGNTIPFPGYGEITAYRSPVDGVLVIEIDTTQANEADGTADAQHVPLLRMYVNDDPIWEHPANGLADDLRLIRKYNDDDPNNS